MVGQVQATRVGGTQEEESRPEVRGRLRRHLPADHPDADGLFVAARGSRHNECCACCARHKGAAEVAEHLGSSGPPISLSL